MIRFIQVAALCLLSAGAFAQFNISGVVRSAGSNAPLPGANISITGGSTPVAADAQGRFSIKVQPGHYSITASFVGYQAITKESDVASDITIDFVLNENVVVTDEVIVSALRATSATPTTFTNVSRQTIAKQNFGQDMPMLLNWTPSLVTTSDAGTGIGYTGLRIRGSDATHINVTINGIPYNDSESQSVYWVDIPDVASSTQSVQIQRGVGTSTNGAGAFGGSVNVETTSVEKSPYAEISSSVGSFNTQKYTFRAGTGLINNVWSFEGRLSKIKSNGYVERATADLDSYYLAGGYYGKRTLLKAIVFGGHELTYQSWYGIDPDMMKINRRFNYAGALYDSLGNVSGYYDRQVDDYRQDHYQLHFSHVLSTTWSVNAAIHYTYGRGYYEEYLQGTAYADLGLPEPVVGVDTVKAGDFIRRQWLDNRFYGATYSVHHATERLDLTIGGAVNRYGNAKHFGEIIWAQYAGSIPIRYHYYDAVSAKNDFNIYSKLNYDLSDRLNGFVDLQYRAVGYQSSGISDDLSPYSIADEFNFFNPKAGLTYSLNESDILYASYAVAHREPTRADYLGGFEKPKSEQLGNLEVGWKKRAANITLELNAYVMDYHNQLVLTGKLNSTGYPIRANVGNSSRVGIEASALVRIAPSLTWNVNATWSRNKNEEYVTLDNESNPVTYRNTDIILSPRLIAGSQLAWVPLKRFEIAWLAKYVGKQYLDNTQRDAVSLAAYFLNDIRFSYTIVPSFAKGIDLGLLVNNIFNTMYSSNGAVYGDVPYFYPQAGRNLLARITMRF